MVRYRPDRKGRPAPQRQRFNGADYLRSCHGREQIQTNTNKYTKPTTRMNTEFCNVLYDTQKLLFTSYLLLLQHLQLVNLLDALARVQTEAVTGEKDGQ